MRWRNGFFKGYYGKNNHESTRIDVISGAVDDVMYLLDRLFYVERVEQAKVVLKQEILSWRLEEFLNVMENTLTENDGGGGFFVGDQVNSGVPNENWVNKRTNKLLNRKRNYWKKLKLLSIIKRVCCHQQRIEPGLFSSASRTFPRDQIMRTF